MNDFIYFIYESTETSCDTSVIFATTLEDAIAEARLLWSNYSENDKRRVEGFSLYRVPAGTEADVGNDASEEIIDLANEQ